MFKAAPHEKLSGHDETMWRIRRLRGRQQWWTQRNGDGIQLRHEYYMFIASLRVVIEVWYCVDEQQKPSGHYDTRWRLEHMGRGLTHIAKTEWNGFEYNIYRSTTIGSKDCLRQHRTKSGPVTIKQCDECVDPEVDNDDTLNSTNMRYSPDMNII